MHGMDSWDPGTLFLGPPDRTYTLTILGWMRSFMPNFSPGGQMVWPPIPYEHILRCLMPYFLMISLYHDLIKLFKGNYFLNKQMGEGNFILG